MDSNEFSVKWSQLRVIVRGIFARLTKQQKEWFIGNLRALCDTLEREAGLQE